MGDLDGPGASAVGAALPPIASHADDLETIKRSVEDAASVSGGLWLSYLLALFYLAVAAGAVSHVDLFLENPVKLPFLNIELQLKAFFFLAPLLFAVIHVYTLTHFVILSNKARWFHDELHRQIAEDEADPDCAGSVQARDIRERLQRQLPANIFVQFLAGPAEIRRSAFGFLLKAVAWTTLVIMPVLLLLLIQVQFLPYHSRLITWTVRLTLLIDLVIVWWLWHIILLGQGEFRRARGLFSRIGTFAGTLATIAVVAFSWTIATFPGETVGTLVSGWRPLSDLDDSGRLVAVSLHDALFHRHIDPTTRRRGIFLSDTIVLPVFDIFQALKVERPKRIDIHRFVFRARGRDLRGAVFDFSILSNVDFEGSRLDGASLARAQLQDASLFCARLQGASLFKAELQNTTFYAADLRGADLRAALGQGAAFDGAHLEGATLYNGTFQAASFRGAHLDAAGLRKADFTLASFERTQLDAACINAAAYRAEPQKAADLAAADLTGAHLDGTALTDAQLQGATLAGATIEGVDLSDAFLWRASLSALKRTSGKPPHLKMTDPIWSPRLGDATPAPWSEADFKLRQQALGAIAPRDDDDGVIARRLAALDCANGKHPSCTESVAPGNPAREALEKDATDIADYAATLPTIVKQLVCAGDWNADHMLRGLVANKRLEAAARQGTRLLDDIQKTECLVSGSLSEDDRNKLNGLKRRLAAQGVAE